MGLMDKFLGYMKLGDDEDDGYYDDEYDDYEDEYEEETHKEVKKENNFENLSIEEHYKYYEEKGLEKKEIIKKIAKDRKVNKNEIYKYFVK